MEVRLISILAAWERSKQLISFENVSKAYRGQQEPVVRDLSFQIPQGQIVVLIGPSGCGKTTCLKMINRLVKITSGKILIDGEDIMERDPIQLRRTMGYVIQQTGIFPHMTVRQNIEIIPTLQKTDKEVIAERTKKLMDMIGLDPDEYLDRYPTQLSGGQMQRVGVARAFATDPEIILMDEPFSAVDPITRSQLQDELLFLQANMKKTIVFVTHDMDEAIRLADKICILNDGVIVQYDTPEKIMKEPADDYVARFVGPNRIWGWPEFIRASDIMIKDPVAVPADLTLIKAIEIMRAERVDSAMVLDESRKFVGMVRANDIQAASDKQATCASIMRQPAAVATPGKNLVELLAAVNETGAKNIPVLKDNGQLAGLVTTSSLVTTMSQQFSDGSSSEEEVRS